MTEAEFVFHYEECAKGVIKFLVWKYGVGRAYDLSQHAWLNAWASRGSFRADASFMSWILRIACNAAVNESRGNSGMRMRNTDAMSEAVTRSARSQEPNAEDVLMRAHVERRVKFAVARNNAADICTMRFVYGMKLREVADALGVCENTVKMRLHRLRLDIRS